MSKSTNYPERSLPADWADDARWFADNFDTTEKVVVYWVPDTAGETITRVGYYDSVSAANTAATAAITNGKKPKVKVNFWHSDFTHYPVGHMQHRRANNAAGAIDLPSWYDEEPAS